MRPELPRVLFTGEQFTTIAKTGGVGILVDAFSRPIQPLYGSCLMNTTRQGLSPSLVLSSSLSSPSVNACFVRLPVVTMSN